MAVDWVFLCIDTLGGLFSLFALGMSSTPYFTRHEAYFEQRQRDRLTS
jgi:hypothetical protein